MTPIERLSEKSQALAILSLAKTATSADIRKAYKRLVLEKHPDHGHGSSDEFSQITDAYQFLKANAEELGIPDAPIPSRRVTSRPSMQAIETEFDDDILAECKSRLPGDAKSAQHISTMLHRMGRKLTYFVPTALANGMNNVAVPTGQLVDARHAVPQVVPVEAKDMSGGIYNVPSDIRDQLFPGARSVQIRFAS